MRKFVLPMTLALKGDRQKAGELHQRAVTEFIAGSGTVVSALAVADGGRRGTQPGRPGVGIASMVESSMRRTASYAAEYERWEKFEEENDAWELVPLSLSRALLGVGLHDDALNVLDGLSGEDTASLETVAEIFLQRDAAAGVDAQHSKILRDLARAMDRGETPYIRAIVLARLRNGEENLPMVRTALLEIVDRGDLPTAVVLIETLIDANMAGPTEEWLRGHDSQWEEMTQRALGYLLHRIDKLSESEGFLRQAAISHGDSFSLKILADSLLQRDQRDEALALLKDAAANDNVKAMRMLADVLRPTDPARADSWLVKALTVEGTLTARRFRSLGAEAHTRLAESAMADDHIVQAFLALLEEKPEVS